MRADRAATRHVAPSSDDRLWDLRLGDADDNRAMERLAGETRASDDLDRRRRLGTLIAAMLLAGGGRLLAATVGVLERPALADVIVRPWAVARAGVSNAVIVLSLSTVAASLFWLWREFTSRRPLRDWRPARPIRNAPIVRVAHLSDLHLVGERYGYRIECGTHGPSGNTYIRQALDKLRAVHASTPLDRVLMTRTSPTRQRVRNGSSFSISEPIPTSDLASSWYLATTT